MEWSRRSVVKALGAAASAACMAGLDLHLACAEPPPEVGRIRLVKASLCSAPLYVAQELLYAEGFSDVQYLDDDAQQIGTSKPVATGAADLNLSFGLTTLLRIDGGEPVVMLGGIHAGCYELFGSDRIRSILHLRGRRVAVPGPGSTQHLFLSIIASYVGMDPQRDIDWVTLSREEGMQHLAQGKVDAYLGFPPDPQQLRARRIGHTLLNSTLDKPWSQYFCCMVIGNRDFVQHYPIATRRALRALLKATDLCATQPERAAQFLVEQGYASNRDDALATLSEVQYRSWREYNPEDSVRFFALRLRDAGMIKSTPQRLLEQGTDWRLFNALKRELKV